MSIMIIIIYPELGEKLSWGTVDYEMMNASQQSAEFASK